LLERRLVGTEGERKREDPNRVERDEEKWRVAHSGGDPTSAEVGPLGERARREQGLT